jgi:hypothetical protein
MSKINFFNFDKCQKQYFYQNDAIADYEDANHGRAVQNPLVGALKNNL